MSIRVRSQVDVTAEDERLDSASRALVQEMMVLAGEARGTAHASALASALLPLCLSLCLSLCFCVVFALCLLALRFLRAIARRVTADGMLSPLPPQVVGCLGASQGLPLPFRGQPSPVLPSEEELEWLPEARLAEAPQIDPPRLLLFSQLCVCVLRQSLRLCVCV